MSMPVFHLVRESRWVKEYDTNAGRVLDSKYRTYRCDATASEFIDAWNKGSAEERTDMEAAFAFFPHDAVDEAESILNAISLFDSDRAARMRANWEANSGQQSEEQVQFLLELGNYLDVLGVTREFVGGNHWFRVFATDARFEIETLVHSVDEMPSDKELEALEHSTSSRAYRHAVQLVRGCRFLLAPESAFKARKESPPDGGSQATGPHQAGGHERNKGSDR